MILVKKLNASYGGDAHTFSSFQHGLTPLHLASYQGNEGIVRKLIQTEDCVLDQKTSRDVSFIMALCSLPSLEQAPVLNGLTTKAPSNKVSRVTSLMSVTFASKKISGQRMAAKFAKLNGRENNSFD